MAFLCNHHENSNEFLTSNEHTGHNIVGAWVFIFILFYKPFQRPPMSLSYSRDYKTDG